MRIATRRIATRHRVTILAAACAGLLALVAACSSTAVGGSTAGTSDPSTSSSSDSPATSSSDSSAQTTTSTSDSAGSGSSAPQGTTGLNTSPADDPAAPVLAAIASDPTLAATLPEAIRTNGIKVATSVPYPPMELFAKDGTTPIGVDPDIARAVGNRLGVKVDLINVDDFNAQIPGIISGRYDMVISSMTDTKERQGKVTFVDYVLDGQGFLVKGGNPDGIHQPSDMCGKTLAVVDNGSALTLGQQISSDCTKAGSKAVNILKFTGDSDAILAVKSGRAAADIEDYPVAAYHAQTSNGQLDSVQISGGEAPLGMGIDPKNTELIQGVQKALQSLIDDGSYAKVLGAWDVSGMALPKATVNAGTE